MSLQDYKLFYEKDNPNHGEDDIKQIAVSTTGIPSDSDIFLSFTDISGDAITYHDLRTYCHFFYEKLKQIIFASESRSQIPSIDDAQVNVYAGDDLLFGTELVSIEFVTDPDIVTTLHVTATYNGGQFSSGDSIPKGDSIVFVFTSNSNADVIAEDEDGTELFTVTSEDFTGYEYTPEENISIVFYQDSDE